MEDEQRKEFIRQVFNTVCEQYGKGSLRFFENAASHLPGLLNLNGDENILDIATGTGLASTLLASHLPDGQVTFENDGIGLGFTLGALYEFSPQTRIGLSYRSETNPDLEGEPEFTNLGPVRRDVHAGWDLAAHDISIFLYLKRGLPAEVTAALDSHPQVRALHILRKHRDVAFCPDCGLLQILETVDPEVLFCEDYNPLFLVV